MTNLLAQSFLLMPEESIHHMLRDLLRAAEGEGIDDEGAATGVGAAAKEACPGSEMSL